MRILFLTLKTFSATGGIEKFNRSFCKALQENAREHNWQAEVLSAYDTTADQRYFSGKAFTGYGGSRGRFMLAATRRMAAADVVIFSHINLSPLMQLCQLLFPRKQTICIAHGREVWEPLSALQTRMLRQCRQVWAVSAFTAGILHSQKGVPATRTNIFYNTLDPFFDQQAISITPIELRHRYGIKTAQKVLLTVARLTSTEKFKGYDTVLAALPEVLTRFPDLRYLLCGKWDESEKKRIMTLINALKLHNVVKMTGFIKESELSAHYQAADVFILPSRKEGFGIVFLEAAASGIQVIGGNADGSPEALLHGKLGRITDPTNTGAVASAIIAALAAPLFTEQVSIQRQLVADNFGFSTFKKRQAKLLCQLTGTN